LLLQVIYLGMIGGVTVKDTTRCVMSALFSNMLAMQFNFKGHGHKHAFLQLLLKDVNGEASALMNSPYQVDLLC